ncbi:hypothetical protein HCU64_19585 [Methylobacterium sp. C25]|uniref:hypothetical protein n=1 Tax=Methylobacterium sp. C25 TaxID=2721622 RepID=UPI001F488460|nr:hypothetical protein [Methylobacterium sp. C25]MCE4225957.1 hypothetical protein [Methylobacterium sp. C25]
MSALRSLTIELDSNLGSRLKEAADRTGLTPAELVLRALGNELDGLTAYARITDEINRVKDGLASLAGLVGEALAEPSAGEVASICRYRTGA